MFNDVQTEDLRQFVNQKCARLEKSLLFGHGSIVINM